MVFASLRRSLLVVEAGLFSPEDGQPLCETHSRQAQIKVKIACLGRVCCTRLRSTRREQGGSWLVARTRISFFVWNNSEEEYYE